MGCVYETACNYDETATIDDGSCVFYCPGCMDESACNYDSEAQQEDGTCQYLDECGICGGEGIAEGECDCDGNVLDALGEWRSVLGRRRWRRRVRRFGRLRRCVRRVRRVQRSCGVRVRCADIPEGDCDCFGNVLDECGVCGGEGLTGDICDCDGSLFDECGVCGGDGIPEGDCDCFGNQLTQLAFGGDCEADVDADGICDDEDECIGPNDECGVQRPRRHLRLRLFRHPGRGLRL